MKIKKSISFLVPIDDAVMQNQQKLNKISSNETPQELQDNLISMSAQFQTQFQFDPEMLRESQPEQFKLFNPRKRFSIINQDGIDMDDVFGFGKQTIIPSQKHNRRISISKRFTRIFGIPVVDDYDGADLFKSMPEHAAFLILFTSVFLNASVVPLFVQIPENSWSRNGWRFLLQAILLIPFVLYERRTCTQQIRNCYEWSHAFGSKNIRLLILQSINTSMQSTIFTVFADYNYIANNILLASMTNFWLSITRSINNESRHSIELPGQVMCIIGYTLSPDDIPPKILSGYSLNQHYFIDPWQRVILGIFIPITVAQISTQISLLTQELKTLYPPFLQLFLISIFTAINLSMVGFFFFCTTLDGTPITGWFGFIVQGALTKFMYIASKLTNRYITFVLSIGLLFTQIFISQLYEPIIPACASLLAPPFTALFLDLSSKQHMPRSFSIIGYVLIIPGQFIIILGQHIFLKQLNSEKISLPNVAKLSKSNRNTRHGSNIQNLEECQKKIQPK